MFNCQVMYHNSVITWTVGTCVKVSLQHSSRLSICATPVAPLGTLWVCTWSSWCWWELMNQWRCWCRRRCVDSTRPFQRSTTTIFLWRRTTRMTPTHMAMSIQGCHLLLQFHVIYWIGECQWGWRYYTDIIVVIYSIVDLRRTVVVCNGEIHRTRALTVGKTLIPRWRDVGQLWNWYLTALIGIVFWQGFVICVPQ